MTFPERLRDIANALEEDRVSDKVLLVARLDTGEVISEDSGLDIEEAALLARDFVGSLRLMRDDWVRRNRRQLCGFSTRCRAQRGQSR